VDNNSATIASYLYDVNGNMSQRTLNNGTVSSYYYDALDRVRHITHLLEGNTRTFDYDYDSVGNRKWTKRDAGTGDVFGYDYNDQVTVVRLDIANPDTTPVGSQTIFYDINGNRTSFSAYGTPGTYTTNYLNQYSQRNSTLADYNWNGDMRTGFDASTYTYDAQNRLLTARTNSVTDTFTYDGLNRQVSRQVGTGSPIYYNVYDGWDLIGEYASGASTPTASYVFGAGGLLKNVITSVYYYHDASGSTSHLASSGSLLLESYLYDLQGTPTFYDSGGHQLPGGSNYGVRHLFTGQQWYSELGLYDLRNRYYSPDIGRFLQADPTGFNGDATNLYRYCHNNPLKFTDPTGENIVVELTAGLLFGYFVYQEIILPAHRSFWPQPDSRPSSGLPMNTDSLQRWATPQWDTPLPPPPGSISAPPEKQLPDDLEHSDQNPDVHPYWRELRGPEREMLYTSGGNAASGSGSVPGPIYSPGYFGADYVFGSGVGSPGAPYGVDQFGDPLNSPASDYTGGLTPVPGSQDATWSGPGEPLDAPEMIWNAKRGWHLMRTPRGGDLKLAVRW
jgi:RHS repeat-associated protein